MNQRYPSILLERAVNEFAKLPGIGKKTALRLVLFLLKQDAATVQSFGEAFITLKSDIRFCNRCHNISDLETCGICADRSRDPKLLCIVENIKDVMALEATNQFRGLYHVLGGIISPMDGIGPADLEIESLIKRMETEAVQEVIFALSPTMEGDTTNFYLFKKLAKFDCKVSVIARGIAIGDELESADEVTLGRSIVNRTLFNQ